MRRQGLVLIVTLGSVQVAHAETTEAELGKGVTVSSDDGKYSARLKGLAQLQLKHTADDGYDNPALTPFVPRVRVSLAGRALGPELTYFVQLGLTPPDLAGEPPAPLLDAFVSWRIVDAFQLRAGLMKVPFERQFLAGVDKLQLVDRGGSVRELNLNRDTGLMIFGNDLFDLGGLLSYQAGLFGGDGRSQLSEDLGLLAVARAQLAPFGDFADLIESDLEYNVDPKLAIAVATAFNHKTSRARSTTGPVLSDERLDYFHAAFDLHFKWRGFSLLSELLFRRANARYAVDTMPLPLATAARGANGFFVQSGYLLTEWLELEARFDHFRPFGALVTQSLTRQSEVGGGLSWYVVAHSIKVQTDYFALLGDGEALVGHQARLQLQVSL